MIERLSRLLVPKPVELVSRLFLRRFIPQSQVAQGSDRSRLVTRRGLGRDFSMFTVGYMLSLVGCDLPKLDPPRVPAVLPCPANTAGVETTNQSQVVSQTRNVNQSQTVAQARATGETTQIKETGATTETIAAIRASCGPQEAEIFTLTQTLNTAYLTLVDLENGNKGSQEEVRQCKINIQTMQQQMTALIAAKEQQGKQCQTDTDQLKEVNKVQAQKIRDLVKENGNLKERYVEDTGRLSEQLSNTQAAAIGTLELVDQLTQPDLLTGVLNELNTASREIGNIVSSLEEVKKAILSAIEKINPVVNTVAGIIHKITDTTKSFGDIEIAGQKFSTVLEFIGHLPDIIGLKPFAGKVDDIFAQPDNLRDAFSKVTEVHGFLPTLTFRIDNILGGPNTSIDGQESIGIWSVDELLKRNRNTLTSKLVKMEEADNKAKELAKGLLPQDKFEYIKYK